MEVNCGFMGKSFEYNGIFFSKQPDQANNRPIDFSVKLDPSMVMLTIDGKLFLTFHIKNSFQNLSELWHI